MTNGWIDIKNADVILAMGGNPAENHPVGFKWVMEAQAEPQREARRASIRASPARRRSPTATCQIRAGTDIAFLGGLIHYALDAQPLPRRVRPAPHQRAVPHRREVRLRRDAALLRAGTTSRRRTPTSRAGATSSTSSGFAKVDPTLAAPALRVPADEEALRALHAGDGASDLRLQRRGRS